MFQKKKLKMDKVLIWIAAFIVWIFEIQLRLIYPKKNKKHFKEVVDVNKSNRSGSLDIFGNENWTYGNYGPIEISQQHFFLVSDNRFAAMDSRVHEFVHEDDILSVI